MISTKDTPTGIESRIREIGERGWFSKLLANARDREIKPKRRINRPRSFLFCKTGNFASLFIILALKEKPKKTRTPPNSRPSTFNIPARMCIKPRGAHRVPLLLDFLIVLREDIYYSQPYLIPLASHAHARPTFPYPRVHYPISSICINCAIAGFANSSLTRIE